MITPPEKVSPLVGLSRRNLSIGIVVIALIFLTVHVVHGSGSRKAAHRPHHHTVALCISPHAGHHGATCRNQRPRPAKHHPGRHAKPAKQPPIRRHSAPVIRLTALQLYARHLLPTVVRSGPLFNAANLAGQAGTFDSLTSGCSWYFDKIHALTDEVDGVPHPGPWYGTVSALHFRVLGVYHDMTSALLLCITGADSGDDGVIATARTDLDIAIGHLNEIRNHTWWVAYRQNEVLGGSGPKIALERQQLDLYAVHHDQRIFFHATVREGDTDVGER